MKNTLEQIHLSTNIPSDYAGLRLDQALAKLLPHYSRSLLQTWIEAKHIMVDGQTRRPRDKVRGGETVEITATLEPREDWQAQAIDLPIIYEDDAILIINKPAGLVVHPAVGNRDGTLVNALLHHAPQLATLPRAGIVHRLDKNTSGLLVVAKTLSAHHKLVKQMQKRSIKREYEAIVLGQLTAGATIDEPLARHATQRKRMAVNPMGKAAITHYRVLERFPAHTHIKVMLETGRTHQIRVHMAHIHHPLVGDSTYGARLRLPPKASSTLIEQLRHFHRQALHAAKLGLIHPDSGEYCEWSAPIPDDMQQLLDALREQL